jgi:hypothetical protein
LIAVRQARIVRCTEQSHSTRLWSARGRSVGGSMLGLRIVDGINEMVMPGVYVE